MPYIYIIVLVGMYEQWFVESDADDDYLVNNQCMDNVFFLNNSK